ncbi:MAG: hypothetical protein B7Z81_15290, partial [Acidocella sp. 20-61-6]
MGARRSARAAQRVSGRAGALAPCPARALAHRTRCAGAPLPARWRHTPVAGAPHPVRWRAARGVEQRAARPVRRYGAPRCSLLGSSVPSAARRPKGAWRSALRAAYSTLGGTRSLRWALAHARLVGAGLVLTVLLNVALFVVVPKGFFPEQDTGLLIGTVQADQSISFAAMTQKLTELQAIVQHDPGVASVAGFTGGRSTNSAFLFVTLKPLAQRHASATQIVARLRKPLSKIDGAQTFMVPAQDLRVGGRRGNAEYQYTLYSDDSAALYQWIPKIVAALNKDKALADVNSDLQQGGLETD